MPSSSGGVHELLDKAAEAHDHEVSLLRKELDNLRRDLLMAKVESDNRETAITTASSVHETSGGSSQGPVPPLCLRDIPSPPHSQKPVDLTFGGGGTPKGRLDSPRLGGLNNIRNRLPLTSDLQFARDYTEPPGMVSKSEPPGMVNKLGGRRGSHSAPCSLVGSDRDVGSPRLSEFGGSDDDAVISMRSSMSSPRSQRGSQRLSMFGGGGDDQRPQTSQSFPLQARRSQRCSSRSSCPVSRADLALAVQKFRDDTSHHSHHSSPPVSVRSSARISQVDYQNHMEEVGIGLYECWEMPSADAVAGRKTRDRVSEVGMLACSESRRDMERNCDSCERRDASTLMGRHMFRPATHGQITWDVIGLVCILLDIIYLPLQVFTLPRHILMDAVQLLATIFWTLDVPRSFMRGYNCLDGMIEMRPRVVAKRYICTWFLMDISLVTIDWLVWLASENTMSSMSILRTVKSLRISRSLRLLRMFKIMRVLKASGVLQDLNQQCSSVYVLALMKILYMMVSILLCNHVIACGWYGLTTLKEEGEDQYCTECWTTPFIEAGDSSSLFLYTTALHWSLTQFTPASMNVVPHNVLERIYNIIIVLLAMVIFTQLVGSITSTMTELKNLDSQRTKKVYDLQRYLRQHKVSSNLTSRVWQCIHSAKRNPHKTNAADVELLNMLPRRVMADIREEVYRPIYEKHPFFHDYIKFNPTGMNQLYSNAMGACSFDTDEELFTAGDPADKTLFLSSGSLRYRLGFREENPVTEPKVTIENSDAVRPALPDDVPAGQWVCEVTLWLRWTHRGTLISVSPTDVYTLDAKVFRKVLAPYVACDLMLPRYAALYERHATKYLEQMDVWWDLPKLGNVAWSVFQDDFDEYSLAPHNVTTAMPSTWGQNDGLDEWHKQVNSLRKPIQMLDRKASWLHPLIVINSQQSTVTPMECIMENDASRKHGSGSSESRRGSC